jgi:peptidoglycan/LPS O-acetylase OafA/YrhL
MNQTNSQQARVEVVDALRGIAALLVVWMHTSEVFNTLYVANGNPATWVYRVAHWSEFGLFGVAIFFAISGYLIPSSIHGERVRGLKTFAIRRFFRLYPAFWLSIPFGVVTSWTIWGRHISAKDIALNFTMLTGALSIQPAQGLYWTLELELLFYAICALLFACMPRLLRNEAFLFTLSFALFTWYCVPATRSALFAKGTAIHLSAMFWGAGLRTVIKRGRDILKSIGAVGYLILQLTWLAGFDLLSSNTTTGVGKKFFVVTAAANVLFLICLRTNVPRHWALSHLGKVSYSIYLFHPVVFYTLLWLVQTRLPPAWQHIHTGIAVVSVLFTTVGLSTVTYRTLEAPSIALGKRLTRVNQ